MKYFDLSEFQCKHCGELPEDGMSPVLTEALDELRELWGAPIYISSGYRCEYWNEQNGGVPNSRHRVGDAADIYIDGDFNDYQRFYNLVLESNLFDSVGYYPDEEFLHVDTRNDSLTPNYYLW